MLDDDDDDELYTQSILIIVIIIDQLEWMVVLNSFEFIPHLHWRKAKEWSTRIIFLTTKCAVIWLIQKKKSRIKESFEEKIIRMLNSKTPNNVKKHYIKKWCYTRPRTCNTYKERKKMGWTVVLWWQNFFLQRIIIKNFICVRKWILKAETKPSQITKTKKPANIFERMKKRGRKKANKSAKNRRLPIK